MAGRRKDSKGRVLKENEIERKDGQYCYRWHSADGKRHAIYGSTLEELREKEKAVQRDISDGIRVDAARVTLNDIYELWAVLKKGIKHNTFTNYQYMYNTFVRNDIGSCKITKLKRSDIRRYYNRMIDDKGLKVATVDNIHTVLHQILDIAVEDGYLRNNISDNALKELKMSRNLFTEKKKALTVKEQNIFLDYLRNTPQYNHWYPVFAFMLGTGLRVGEATGLRWCDIDMENDSISVNHTLVYYSRDKGHCGFAVNTPKTKAGERTVPMIASVKEALMLEKQYQEEAGIHSRALIDGFTDFIFVNRFGDVQNYGTLNKAINRIVRDCNQAILDRTKNLENAVLLPHFSCHTLRHTFTTRLCESGMNVKVIQEILGHADISTTLDIYADVTKELKKCEMQKIEDFIGNL